MNEVVLDCESRGRADLRRVGARRYAEDPSTELLCVCWLDLRDDVMRVWAPPELRPMLMLDHLQTTASGVEPDARMLTLQVARDDRVPVVGNNVVGFDRLLLPEYADARWVDTTDLARRLSLPGGLQGQGEYLFGVGKDPAGERLIRMLSRDLTPPTPPTLTAMVQYCIRDVELSARVWLEGGLREEWLRGGGEARVLEVDREVNDRGFALDADLAARLIAAERRVRTAEHRAVEAIGLRPDDLRSWQRFTKFMRRQFGITMPNARADLCRALARHPDAPREARAALWARVGEVRAAAPKLTRALEMLEADGRLRGTLRYHVACPTGRWGGRGFQPQNLPRPPRGLPADALERAAAGDAVEVAREVGLHPDDVLGALVRSCVVAPPGRLLAVVDYRSIEARGLCWVAGDERGLDTYRRGADPYVAMAARIYGCPEDAVSSGRRFVGKVAVLGCGYQMGVRKFGRYAADLGLDLEAAGVTASRVVEAFRDAHPLVAGERKGEEYEGTQLRRGGLWRRLHRGARGVVEGDLRELEAARCLWRMRGPHLECLLPSGRAMLYREARIEEVRPAWAPPDSDERARALTYDHVVGSSVHRKQTYGGRLTENVVQGLCRDLLADALARLSDAGIEVVLHVHDEVVAEVDDEGGLAAIEGVMREAPDWAAGLPIDVEGGVARRYGKP